MLHDRPPALVVTPAAVRQRQSSSPAGGHGPRRPASRTTTPAVQSRTCACRGCGEAAPPGAHNWHLCGLRPARQASLRAAHARQEGALGPIPNHAYL